LSLTALVVGALGAIILMLYAGRNSPQRLLIVLFACWVASPFVLLALVYFVSKRLSAITRNVLNWLTLVLAVGTLAIYGYFVFRQTQSIPTQVFVVIPPVSWLLSTIVIGGAAIMSRQRTA
jgi:uncharacterized membrane-anchored protein